MTKDLLYEVDGHVATITLNRPQKLNAVTPEMADAIVAAVKAERKRRHPLRHPHRRGRAGFLRRLRHPRARHYETPWNFRNRPDYCDAIRALLEAVIAAVNGYAFGGGLETAMSCDIRIAVGERAVRGTRDQARLDRRRRHDDVSRPPIGPSNAALMIMTGDPIHADKALAWGLVSDVVPPAGLSRGHARSPTPSLPARRSRPRPRSSTSSAAHSIPPKRRSTTSATSRRSALPPRTPREGRAAFKEKRAPVFRRR